MVVSKRAGTALIVAGLGVAGVAYVALQGRTPARETSSVAASPASPAREVEGGSVAPPLTALSTSPPPPAFVNAIPASGFVGSQRCRECHAKNYEAWSHDWHPRALDKASPRTVRGRFDQAHFKGTSSEAWMRREGGRFVMRTLSQDGKLADHEVDWVIGGKRMQDTVTTFPDGRWQVLPVYFHVTGGGEWVDYTEAKQGALGPDHPFFWTNFRRTANRECLDCHTSGLEVRYEPKARQWSTKFADSGVACESCHGPGERHAESLDPKDIFHPGDAPPELAFSVCGQCHGPRNPYFPVLDAAHRFRAGDRYDDFYTALVLVNGMERSGDFFGDGRPKTSSFEYQAVLQSACHRKGKATCLTCHTAPHKPHGADELPIEKGARTASPDASCVSCHSEQASKRAEHSQHRSAAAQSCVACHMPKTVTGVLDGFADHAIDVPNPDNTVRHGIPSACGVCHTKEAPADLAASFVRLWPNSAARTQRRTRLADAIDEKTASSSEPALRAVVADAEEAPTLRAAAAALLGQRHGVRTEGALLPLLKEADPLLRMSGVQGLMYADAKGSATRVAALASDPALGVRQAVALTLATFNDARADPILQSLTRDPVASALAQPHFVLGFRYLQKGRMHEAEEELEAAVARVPYLIEAQIMLADARIRRGDREGAKTALVDALRFDPQNAPAKKRLAAMSEP